MSERIDINNLLSSMRAMKAQSQAFGGIAQLDQADSAGGLKGVGNANGPKFNDLFSQAINKVNSVQQESASLANSYITGDSSVDIADVMIASQKSSVAFQAMTQVRNKVVEAYKDVMNMPI